MSRHAPRNLALKLERIRREAEQHPDRLDLALSGLELSVVPCWALERDLIELDLSRNHLVEVPEELALLERLATLDLRHNRLTAVPPAVRALGRLEELWLDGNRIEAVPDWLGELPALGYVQLRGNPIPATERARIEARLPGLRLGW
ncbi:MAG: leucine-rich repeat domain-containing protein [Myxococcales bacterium]|nr:leucine-rich repeat domain-containing protein [Myxococcales bacterium]